ncbi:nucleoside-diphosphate sugar epimerase/dehydratase [Bacillus sp. 31A1R]|uniref:Nucleoside-diphosphate sugar epimerase/dehydratase n=1 Tax=Robertmurraya mangrovi TaxID=3098077 RepID=A0ABU5J1N3_9BACI|nr:nucleoside-diphosphate sugar epimerase/dehydratase [Bacillus sp. 31A1R]MDZ5473328.1 nucleoside-diphosphate sugar epimerase/dehydratase [Bacillus sp. 31A1R]
MIYQQRVTILTIIDSLMILIAILISSLLVTSKLSLISIPLLTSSFTLLLLFHYFSIRYRLYKKAWEYASIGELVIILKAVTFSILITFLVQQLFLGEIYLRLLATTWLINLLFIGGSRFCWRVYRDTFIKYNHKRKRTLIIGAGSAGTMVARQLINNHECVLLPVAFIDDNPQKHKLDILGIPVYGGVTDIEKAVLDLEINNIIIAIPSLNKKELNTIFQECVKTHAKTKILPMLEDLVTGKVSVSQFRDVQVEDLLGREPIELDINSISEYISNKTVLVTGAGGSIGSEICRQIVKFNPRKLILMGHGENSIYNIETELNETFKGVSIEIVTEIADLQDANKMETVMNIHKPNVLYHAAAHKHVPLMERNPEEAVKNNILGTINIANAANLSNVERFVMISTDKAVKPSSVMGATKRLAEMVIQYMDQQSQTQFVAVRFGNVLGSRGSVIPLFKKQIEKGGPVTVTHPDMVRYFMTIPEAARLVIQAGALAKGGEIFVLDMGEPVKIMDLAKNLIKLSGNTIEDIGIEFSGIRPGEKLFEELLDEEEILEEQVYPKIYIGKPAELFIEEIEDIINTFSNMDREMLRETLIKLANKKTYQKSLMPSSRL